MRDMFKKIGLISRNKGATMNIEIMSPSELKPYDKNPRINEAAIESVANSIEKFGFNQPIVVNQDNVICVGHTRWKASQKLGMKTVPVYKRKMSEKEFIAYNLADNRTAENAKWDDELLSELMNELDNLDSSYLEYTGFSDKELEALLEDDSLDELLDETQVAAHTRTNSGEKAHVKMVQIFLNDISFPIFIDQCERLQAHYETANLTDTISYVINKANAEL